MTKNTKKQKYVCIFPYLKNTHINKDVGLIPYTMDKYFHYDSYIITYENDDYSNLRDKNPYLSLIFLKKIFNNPLLDISIILLKIRNTNVLQVFFLQDTLNIVVFSLIYKILNKNGKFYVKLDADEYSISLLTKKNRIEKKIQNFMIKYLIDCVSIETSQNYRKLVDTKIIDSKKLIFLPNGLDDEFKIKVNNKKENYILTVGRIGTKQKATEVLLEAFSKIKNLEGWKLILIGEINQEFQQYIKNYFHENKNLQDKVLFKGHISNRDEIYEYYSKSKIFCLTSRWESFGIVLIEALYFGNYLVTTDVGAAKDVLKITNYGELIKKDDTEFLALRLQDLILNWHNYEKEQKLMMGLIRKNYNWKVICNILYKKLNET